MLTDKNINNNNTSLNRLIQNCSLVSVNNDYMKQKFSFKYFLQKSLT